MPHFVIDIECDGAAFHGTQAQSGLRSVQGELERACSALNGAPCIVRPASRLDGGVSAEHLPCDVPLDRDWDPSVLARALVPLLPHDLSIRRAAKVGERWNARHHAKRKTYRYRVLERSTRPACDRRRLWVRRLPQAAVFDELTAWILGKNDLSGFASSRDDGKDTGDPRRNILAAAWTATPEDGGTAWTFRITGAGFLYQQVRGLVGAMVHCARGKATAEDFRQQAARGLRSVRRIGNFAAPQGLTLESVAFDPEPDWQLP